MFNTARIRLTLLYSLVFLACFWMFSIGLYTYTERSFEVEVGEQVMPPPNTSSDPGEAVIDINETPLDRLFSILMFLNALVLPIIPALSWFLTGKALEPVRKAHERQRQFVSDAAHELRTPLTIIQSEIEIALARKRGVEAYRATLASSQQEIVRLSELAERLLFLARHDDAHDDIVLKSVDLTDLVSSVLASYRTTLHAKNLALAFHPSENSITVRGNVSLLTRLIANMLDNGVKYTAAGGNITVTLQSNAANARVTISDSGIGIAPHMHEKIFDRFVRADASRGETKGFGLGLAISRAIAEKHGGTVSVSSVLGQGSAFTVNLPLA